jgi:hypothetical protein
MAPEDPMSLALPFVEGSILSEDIATPVVGVIPEDPVVAPEDPGS